MINKKMTLRNVGEILNKVYEERPLYVNEFFEEELFKIIVNEYNISEDDAELVIYDVTESMWGYSDNEVLEVVIDKAISEGLITS